MKVGGGETKFSKLVAVFTIAEVIHLMENLFHDLVLSFYLYSCDIKFFGGAILPWFWHTKKRVMPLLKVFSESTSHSSANI